VTGDDRPGGTPDDAHGATAASGASSGPDSHPGHETTVYVAVSDDALIYRYDDRPYYLIRPYPERMQIVDLSI
jgi:hypothetical protein